MLLNFKCVFNYSHMRTHTHISTYIRAVYKFVSRRTMVDCLSLNAFGVQSFLFIGVTHDKRTKELDQCIVIR